jgi:pyruvate kinase
MVVNSLGENSDRALQNIQQVLLESGAVSPGEYVVLLAGQPLLARGSTNFIKVEKIG